MKMLIGIGAFAVSLALIAFQVHAESSCQDVDFDHNGAIDDVDIEIFKTTFGTSEGDSGYIAAADLDGSGTITPTDFGIFLSCR